MAKAKAKETYNPTTFPLPGLVREMCEGAVETYESYIRAAEREIKGLIDGTQDPDKSLFKDGPVKFIQFACKELGKAELTLGLDEDARKAAQNG